MNSDIIPAAQQTLLLSTKPHKFHSPARSILLKISAKLHDDRCPSHIIIGPRSLRHRIIMRRNRQDLIFLIRTFDPRHYITGSARRHILFHNQAHLRRTLRHQLHCIPIMKIRPRNPATIFFLHLVNILCRLRQSFCLFCCIPRKDHRQAALTGNPVHSFIQRRTLHTDKTNSPGAHQSLIHITTHPAIHHNDLTLRPGKTDSISILHIQKIRFQTFCPSISTSSIPGHHILLLIRLHNLKHRPVDPKTPKRKLLHPILHSEAVQSIPDHLRRLHFPSSTRFSDKIKPGQKLHLPLTTDFLRIHNPTTFLNFI